MFLNIFKNIFLNIWFWKRNVNTFKIVYLKTRNTWLYECNLSVLLPMMKARLILIDPFQQLIPHDQNRKAGNYFSRQIEYRRNVIFLKLSAHRLSHFLPHAPLRGNLWNRLSDVARIGVSHIEGMTVGKDGFHVASTCTSSVYLFSATGCPGKKKEREKKYWPAN